MQWVSLGIIYDQTAALELSNKKKRYIYSGESKVLQYFGTYKFVACISL